MAINFEELSQAIQLWEHELDTFGTQAPLSRFKQHLSIAPEGCPSKQILSDYVNSLQFAQKRTH